MAITQHFNRVKKFMQLAQQETPEKITPPDAKTAELRARLVLEEAFELVSALGVRVDVKSELQEGSGWNGALAFKDLQFEAVSAPDLIQIAKESADVSVVNVGTLIACGIEDAAVLKEVDENNLLKFKHVCPKCGVEQDEDDMTLGEAVERVGAPGNPPPGTRVCLNHDCGHIWQSGYRRADGKWVKPENHPKPDIQGVFRKQDDQRIERGQHG